MKHRRLPSLLTSLCVASWQKPSVGLLLLSLGMLSGLQAANDFCPIQANISRVNNACRFDTNGSLSLNPTGGVAPYSYNWSTGANTQNITGLAAGAYSYTITDSNGCEREGSFSVLANTPVVSNPTVNNVSCYGEAQGSASLSPSGGVGPYTFAWNTGATTSSINNLSAGVYAYTVTDSEGCTVDGDFSVLQPAPVWTTFTQQYACGGNDNGSAQIFANGGTPPYSYSWSNGATTAAINNLTPGMYFYTVTDALGCQSSSGLVCIFRSVVNVNVSAATTSCADENNGSASLTVTDGLPPITYAWSNGATTANVNDLAPGIYGYTVTDAGGCNATGNITIGSSSPIFVIVNQTASGNLTASASGGTGIYTYAWSNGETGATATQFNTGSYTLTVTDSNGCAFTISGIVTTTSTCPDNFTFAGNIGSDQYLCAPGNVPATLGETAPASGGSGPIEYVWMRNGTGGPFLPGFYYPIPNSNSPTYSPGPLDATTYFIRCIRRAGCVYLESNVVAITVGNELEATINHPSLGCAFQTQAYSIGNVNAFASAEWTFDGPVSVSSTSGQSVDVTFLGAGYLDVSVTVTEGDCSTTLSERVTIAGNCFGNGNNGSSNLSSTDGARLFPNPVHDLATLQLGQHVDQAREVRVYSATQSLLAIYPLSTDRHQIDLDLSQQPSGLYLIQIMGEDAPLESLKIIKER